MCSSDLYRRMREQKLGRTGSAAETISSLTVAVKQWPTPRASMNENRTGKDAPTHGVTHGRTLAGAVSHHAPTTPTDGPNGSPRADLNPRFVAALMGLPWDWLTPSTSAATASSLNAPQPPGSNSPNDSRTD